MTSHLHALCFDANDPVGLARFWAGVLGWETADDPYDGIALAPNDDTGFRLRFLPTQEKKTVANQMHFDLTSTSLEDQQQTVVARALELGGRHIDIGQRPDEEHVVLADPEGNEFCVIEPGNNFLADCGFIGALACDGSQEVGYFWSGRWAGRWSGTRTRRPRSARRTAVRRSPGAVRRWRRRPGSTGCTSTSPRRPTAISRRRSTVSSPSVRRGSTSARARSTGW